MNEKEAINEIKKLCVSYWKSKISPSLAIEMVEELCDFYSTTDLSEWQSRMEDSDENTNN